MGERCGGRSFGLKYAGRTASDLRAETNARWDYVLPLKLGDGAAPSVTLADLSTCESFQVNNLGSASIVFGYNVIAGPNSGLRIGAVGSGDHSVTFTPGGLPMPTSNFVSIWSEVSGQIVEKRHGDVTYIAPNAAFPASFIATHHQISEDRATIGVNVSIDDIARLLKGR